MCVVCVYVRVYKSFYLIRIIINNRDSLEFFTKWIFSNFKFYFTIL